MPNEYMTVKTPFGVEVRTVGMTGVVLAIARNQQVARQMVKAIEWCESECGNIDWRGISES